MNDNLDAFVQSLQATIDADALDELGEIAFQRWKNPLYHGAMPGADARGVLRGTCGDSITIYLKFDGSRVTDASFETDGCGPSQVCGSFAAEVARGKTPEEILDITGEQILTIVGGLPKDHVHCAFLAAAVLHAAVDDLMAPQS